MSPIKRVSRQGLIRCPGCKAHVKASEQLASGRCIFCGVNLDAAPSRGGSEETLRRVVAAGRSGVIAASLLGLGTFGACVSGDPPDPNADTSVTDTGVATDAGADAVTDTMAVALYGIPADMMTPDPPADAGADAGPDDTQPQVLYGLPPDDG